MNESIAKYEPSLQQTWMQVERELLEHCEKNPELPQALVVGKFFGDFKFGFPQGGISPRYAHARISSNRISSPVIVELFEEIKSLEKDALVTFQEHGLSSQRLKYIASLNVIDNGEFVDAYAELLPVYVSLRHLGYSHERLTR